MVYSPHEQVALMLWEPKSGLGCYKEQDGIMDIYEITGTNLKAWRKRLGFTQQEIAEKADISVAFLSFLENGRRKGSLLTYSRLAAALGVPLGDLVEESGQGAGRKGRGEGPFKKLSEAERDALYKLIRTIRKQHGTSKG